MNLHAFPMRFDSTCRSRKGSPTTYCGIAGSISRTSSMKICIYMHKYEESAKLFAIVFFQSSFLPRPFPVAIVENSSMDDARSSCKSNDTSSNTILPACNLDRSSTSFTRSFTKQNKKDIHSIMKKKGRRRKMLRD